MSGNGRFCESCPKYGGCAHKEMARPWKNGQGRCPIVENTGTITEESLLLKK